MAAQPSVTVIGAGIAGVSTARELALLGCRDVVLVDQAHVASGSSALSAGVYNRQYVDPLDIELRVLAARILEDLERDRGLGIIRNGYLRIARDAATMASFQRSLELQRALGFDGGAVLDADALAAIVPHRSLEGIEGGLWGADDGYLDGHVLCTLLAEHAAELGVRLRLRSAVQAIESTPGGGLLLSTSTGPIECDVVVNAAGPWAGTVGDLLGAPVAIRPQRHEAFIFEHASPLSYLMPSTMDYVVGQAEPGLFVRAEGHKQMLAQLHTNEFVEGDELDDPDQFFRGAIGDHVEEMAARLMRAFPSFDDLGYQSGWAGLYPLSEDNLPVIGPSGHDARVYNACGLGGVGVNLGPAVGRLVAEWIVAGEPTSMPAAVAFQASRFATADDGGAR